VSAFLNGAKVASKEEWLHNFSHVAFADAEGILLRSGMQETPSVQFVGGRLS
jgi:hypothetical protein